jgi:hypothetical protein
MQCKHQTDNETSNSWKLESRESVSRGDAQYVRATPGNQHTCKQRLTLADECGTVKWVSGEAVSRRRKPDG